MEQYRFLTAADVNWTGDGVWLAADGAAACNTEALALVGEWMSVDELYSEIAADRKFYEGIWRRRDILRRRTTDAERLFKKHIGQMQGEWDIHGRGNLRTGQPTGSCGCDGDC